MTLLLIACLLAIGHAACARNASNTLAGHWNGGDWGSVDLDADLSGHYSSTFNDLPGVLSLSLEARSGATLVYTGTWRETTPTVGHPVRRGNLTLMVTGETVSVHWTATDGDAARSAGGASTWSR